MKSQLKIIMLRIMEKKPMSGYDLVKEIHNTTGYWKPSYGSIYPSLKELHANGLISLHNYDRKKIYTLTAKGRITLREILKTKDKMFDMTMNSLRSLEAVCDRNELEFVRKLHTTLRNNMMPFRHATKQMHDFTNVMMDLNSADKMAKHEKQIKKIINDSTIKLKKILED